MKYKVGDKVRIKSIDWYNANKTSYGSVLIPNSKYHFGERASKYCGNILTIRHIENDAYIMLELSIEVFFTDEMIEGLVEERKDMGEISDGYHTFNELYEYRLLYNASMFNELAKQGLYDVHKSKRHSNGEIPFGDSNWFIVMAELPTGQISNHYEMKDWDLFQIPEKEKANVWDGHTPKDVAERIRVFLTPKPKYPTTYEECCEVLGLKDLTNMHLSFMDKDVKIIASTNYHIKTLILLNCLTKLKICRDAYWKIAGIEIGLSKSWEPDWENLSTKHEYIVIKKGCFSHSSRVLVFPTTEMRDAFYENFKDLINECKELL